MSQQAVSPLQLPLQDIRLAERELHDAEGRIGMTGSGEDAAPADVEVLERMHPPRGVDHTPFWIVAHARRSHVVIAAPELVGGGRRSSSNQSAIFMRPTSYSAKCRATSAAPVRSVRRSSSESRQVSLALRKPKRSRSAVRLTRFSGSSDCSQAMKTSPTCAGQALGSPFISAASSVSNSSLQGGCKRECADEVGRVPLVEIADPHAEVQHPFREHEGGRGGIDEHPSELRAHDRLAGRRVRMLEEVAADEIVLVAEPAIDLAVGIQQRARVLDPAESEHKQASLHAERRVPMIGAEHRLAHHAPAGVEAEIHEVGVDVDADVLRGGARRDISRRSG